MKKKYNLLSLFSGIGQFETGFEKAGIEYDLFKYCEFDKKIAKAFSVVHNVPLTANLGDITKVNTDELKDELNFLDREIDIMTYGFVCKSFSVAGKKLGFDDDKYGDLFFHSARIAKEIKPKILIAENVKNLASHDGGNTLNTILNTLDDIGYVTFWKVLISSDYGVPQARERWYAVSIRKDVYEELGCKEFEFPKPILLEKTVADYIIDGSVRKPFLHSVAEYMNSEHLSFTKYRSRVGIRKVYDGMVQGHATSGYASHRVYSIYGSAPTLVCSNDQQYYEIGGYLTGTERLMLQGLSKENCDKLIDNGFSDGTLSKMAGNAVTAEVFENLIKQIDKYINGDKYDV